MPKYYNLKPKDKTWAFALLYVPALLNGGQWRERGVRYVRVVCMVAATRLSLEDELVKADDDNEADHPPPDGSAEASPRLSMKTYP